nr:zinc ribbon domain-containing protein [Lachnospiraceae bacterium]
IKRRPDGTRYKDFLYYGCKHRTMIRGHKCSFSKQIREELLDEAVKEVIVKLVSNPKFADMMQKKINMKVDTDEIDKELESIEKELRRHILKKDRIIEELDYLNVEDKHYSRMKNDYNDRLYKIYDKIEELENLLSETRKKKRSIENDKVTADNVYKTLIYFEELYDQMNQEEKRQLLKSLKGIGTLV